MNNKVDCLDSDLNAHVAHYLSELGNKLELSKLMELTLENPTKALSVIRAAQKVLSEERRKASILYTWATGAEVNTVSADRIGKH